MMLPPAGSGASAGAGVVASGAAVVAAEAAVVATGAAVVAAAGNAAGLNCCAVRLPAVLFAPYYNGFSL